MICLLRGLLTVDSGTESSVRLTLIEDDSQSVDGAEMDSWSPAELNRTSRSRAAVQPKSPCLDLLHMDHGMKLVPIEEESDKREDKGRNCCLGGRN